MHRPELWSTSRDSPAQPSMPASAGITVSRMCLIPTSMNDGCASMVVERAYTIDTLLLGRRLDGTDGSIPLSHTPPRGQGKAMMKFGPVGERMYECFSLRAGRTAIRSGSASPRTALLGSFGCPVTHHPNSPHPRVLRLRALRGRLNEEPDTPAIGHCVLETGITAAFIRAIREIGLELAQPRRFDRRIVRGVPGIGGRRNERAPMPPLVRQRRRTPTDTSRTTASPHERSNVLPLRSSSVKLCPTCL